MSKEGRSNYQSDLDRESLLRARDKYGEVKSLIGELGTKLSKVSSHIEKEFLAAYRVHMLSVQEELQDLREAVVQAEKNLKEDHEVSTLESEVSWFTEETTRLRNQANAMKEDIRHILNRINALKEQRQYLGEQLKTTLKRTRIMQADMELSVMNNGDAWKTLERESEEFKNNYEETDAPGMNQPVVEQSTGAGAGGALKDRMDAEESATPARSSRVGSKAATRSYSTSKLPPSQKRKREPPQLVRESRTPYCASPRAPWISASRVIPRMSWRKCSSRACLWS